MFKSGRDSFNASEVDGWIIIPNYNEWVSKKENERTYKALLWLSRSAHGSSSGGRPCGSSGWPKLLRRYQAWSSPTRPPHNSTRTISKRQSSSISSISWSKPRTCSWHTSASWTSRSRTCPPDPGSTCTFSTCSGPPPCLHQSHVLRQQDISHPQGLVLVLAHKLLHLLDLCRAQLVALGRVLVVLGQLSGHLLPTVRSSLGAGHRTFLWWEQLDVTHRLEVKGSKMRAERGAGGGTSWTNQRESECGENLNTESCGENIETSKDPKSRRQNKGSTQQKLRVRGFLIINTFKCSKPTWICGLLRDALVLWNNLF